ncbi:ribonuclease P protein component [Bradymonas sediminis]|uniref:Ribonuclease P protein component n=1 Tax=Bradymonas sediminis TaxID=1548548 RepID=A0A2Z4FGW6_9DELT|nr:ribonuclease P protein component [Bradymonas sediminis]AWV88203.1 ribonuclease P protein component [Bradymonas sediminis]
MSMPERHSDSPTMGVFQEDARLRKVERLRKRPEFLATQRKGKRRSGAHFIVYGRPTRRDFSRLGVTASRKVGGATVRNWWKRRVREIFRLHKVQIPVGMDFVVIVKASGTRAKYDVLQAELLRLLEQAAPSKRSRPVNPG